MSLFRSWSRVLPLLFLEWLARAFGPDGATKINDRDWVVWQFTKDSALVVAKAKWATQKESRDQKERQRREKKEEKALNRFLKLRSEYPTVLQPYLKDEEEEDYE